eukprot:449419_1
MILNIVFILIIMIIYIFLFFIYLMHHYELKELIKPVIPIIKIIYKILYQLIWHLHKKKDKMNATKNQLGVDTLNNDINSKFNIHVMSSDSDKTDVTFTDRLYEHIINGKIIQQNEFIPIKQFIDKNEYETDSITDDIIDENESNIGYYFGDKIVKVFKNYHKDYHRYDKLSSASFSLGLEWNYWDISDALFVPKCYASLKEEILESTFLTIQQWNENVAMKADELMKAHETKKK